MGKPCVPWLRVFNSLYGEVGVAHQMTSQLKSSSALRRTGRTLIACAALMLFVGGGVNARDAQKQSDGEEGIDPDNLPEEMSASLEELLSDPEGVAPDREEKRCITRRVGLQTEILDSEHLLFRRSVGGKVWLNRLTPGCIGLKPDMVLILRGNGGNICQLDRVQGQSRLGSNGVPSGICGLGKFEPITELHAKTLEDTFNLRRRELAEARRKERNEKRKQRRKERSERRAARKAARAEAAS